MDAWETLAALSTTGDAWERLNGITGGGGGVIALDVGTLTPIEAGVVIIGTDLVTLAEPIDTELLLSAADLQAITETPDLTSIEVCS